MSIKEFLEYRWEDSRINGLIFDKDLLKLSIKDWREAIKRIEFDNVFELHLSDYYDEDISHININKENENKLTVSFYSAWKEQEILKFSFELHSVMI